MCAVHSVPYGVYTVKTTKTGYLTNFSYVDVNAPVIYHDTIYLTPEAAPPPPPPPPPPTPLERALISAIAVATPLISILTVIIISEVLKPAL